MRFLPLLLISFIAVAFVGSAPLFGASRTKTHPRLFFGQEDLPGLLSRISTPQGKAIMARLDACMPERPEPAMLGHTAAGYAIRYAIQGDSQSAAKALEAAELAAQFINTEKADSPLSNQFCARTAVGLAIAYDLCYNAWPGENRARISQTLGRLAASLASSGPERTRSFSLSHQVTLFNAAAGLAALAIAGENDAPRETAAHGQAARLQIKRYLDNLGDKGWPREGFGELRSTIGQGLGAFLLAWRRVQGEDLISPTPARWWAALYATLLLPPDKESTTKLPDLPYFGLASAGNPPEANVRWERSSINGGDVAATLAISDAAARAALQWSFDHCLGYAGDRSYDVTKPCDALFVLLGLPSSESSLDPATILERSFVDSTSGLVVLRNQWNNEDDAIAAIHANQRPTQGLRSFADAGSFRLLALGGCWAVQRQKDKADLLNASREKENVVVIPGTHGWHAGVLTQVATHPDGSGSVGINLDATYTVAPFGASPAMLDPTQDLGIRGSRSWAIDYSGSCGAPVMMIVIDQIRNGPTRRWLMHTNERKVHLFPDGFELTAANGATLHASVITPARPRLSVDKGEGTDTIAIDGESDFFIIMTVQPAGSVAPVPKKRGQGLDTEVSLGACNIRFDGKGVAIQ